MMDGLEEGVCFKENSYSGYALSKESLSGVIKVNIHTKFVKSNAGDYPWESTQLIPKTEKVENEIPELTPIKTEVAIVPRTTQTEDQSHSIRRKRLS